MYLEDVYQGGGEFMDNSDLWTNILAKIKKETNSLSYQTWFEDTKLYSLEKGVAKILVPYALHKDHLANL